MLKENEWGLFYSMVQAQVLDILTDAGRFSHTRSSDIPDSPAVTPVAFMGTLKLCQQFLFPKTAKWFEENLVGYVRGFPSSSPNWDTLTRLSIMKAAAKQLPATENEGIWREAFKHPEYTDIALHAFSGNAELHLANLPLWWESNQKDRSAKNRLYSIVGELLEKHREKLFDHLKTVGARWEKDFRQVVAEVLKEHKVTESVFQEFTTA